MKDCSITNFTNAIYAHVTLSCSVFCEENDMKSVFLYKIRTFSRCLAEFTCRRHAAVNVILPAVLHEHFTTRVAI